jgi:protein tyrosine phosphatase (PTP) superfamily phosphohydrolase (DUF442 family)
VQPGSFSSQFEPRFFSEYDSGIHLFGPQPLGDAPAREPLPPGPSEPPAGPPTVRDDRDASPPVDIPQFAVVKDGVANGWQPYPDGVRWLADHRYRTVLYLHPPGEDDSIPRKVFEKRGLRFVGLEVAPNALTKEVVERFNRLADDAENRPLFVYDKEGAVAGGLWYLYFRAAGASDEKARTEAARLGFYPDGAGEQRTMWIAIQRYLRDNP